ncbi:MAG: DUF4185 domain-containing protein [Candidatus Rokubacteria bacterium]|nr:DUF4185 domain-containing protein [Candidatus Rokubacteria bacterium]
MAAVIVLWGPKLQYAATKICQVTGAVDRERPDQPTGFQRSGVTGGVTGTDLGFPFEYGDRLVMLFGDSREFDPDRCQPEFCGTEDSRAEDGQPQDNSKLSNDPVLRLKRWHTWAEWGRWKENREEGTDSIATAPLAFDPDQCIPASVETDERGSVYGHELSADSIGVPFRLGGPAVAARPEDKWVTAVDGRILVTTAIGATFAHEVAGTGIGTPFKLSGPPVGARPEDKWTAAIGDRLLVGTSDGRVFAHRVTTNVVEAAVQLSGPKVGARPEDRWVLTTRDGLLVVTTDGRVFRHSIVGDTIAAPFQLAGPPVAARPEDKWLLVMDDRLLVITKGGDLFVHPLTNNAVGTPVALRDQFVGGNPQDKRALVMGHRLLILTGQDGRFRPTQLNGQSLGRREGAIGAVVSDTTIHAFFTMRDRNNVAHDDEKPGGQSVLAHSTDGGRSFHSSKTVSTTKFLWTVPVVEQASRVGWLPKDIVGDVVLVWGAGRQNQQGDATPFHHSYPYLAVAPLASIATLSTWRYYTGLDATGHPAWKRDAELQAQPVLPFGTPESDSRFGPGYHQCLGYFSVRRIDAWGKWAMLYACNNDPRAPLAGYNPNNGPRGIYLRTAELPWGPWSVPRRVFNPDEGYCHFMYRVSNDCPPGSPNPVEESVRDTRETPNVRASGGEYAPILLPSRYVKSTPDGTALYFLMATWNPYQVVLMRIDVTQAPILEQLAPINRVRQWLTQ